MRLQNEASHPPVLFSQPCSACGAPWPWLRAPSVVPEGLGELSQLVRAENQSTVSSSAAKLLQREPIAGQGIQS